MIGRLPLPLRRLAYRVGFVVVRIGSQVFRPRTRGVKCLVAHGDAVLLVRHAYGAKQWDLAGGFCRRGEDFADSARREIAEELGVGIVGLTDLGEELRRFHGRRETLRLFRIDLDIREVAIDHGEIDEARWCGRDALPVPRAEIVDIAVARERTVFGETAPRA